MRIVNEDVLQRFREFRFCECCNTPTPGGTDPAHIGSRGAGRVDAAWNLCALDRACHTRHHAGGKPTRQDLLAIAAKREGTTVQAILDALAYCRAADENGKVSRVMPLGREARRLVKQAMEGVQT